MSKTSGKMRILAVETEWRDIPLEKTPTEVLREWRSLAEKAKSPSTRKRILVRT